MEASWPHADYFLLSQEVKWPFSSGVEERLGLPTKEAVSLESSRVSLAPHQLGESERSVSVKFSKRKAKEKRKDIPI